MRVIAVANQKGGTSKTTTCGAIVAGAAARGHRVLAIDADPQSSLTYSMGADANRPGTFDLMTGKASDVIQHTSGGDIIPGSLQLATMDRTTTQQRGNSLLLRAALASIHGYDLMVIDCAPSLGVLMVNSLTAATEVLIPMQADILSLQGLYLIRETITQVQDNLNPSLTVAGCFLTRYNGRSVVTRDMTTAIKNKCASLGLPYIDTPIREGVAVKEAQLMRQSVMDYAPKSKPAQDYNALLDALEI